MDIAASAEDTAVASAEDIVVAEAAREAEVTQVVDVREADAAKIRAKLKQDGVANRSLSPHSYHETHLVSVLRHTQDAGTARREIKLQPSLSITSQVAVPIGEVL